jgi:hypothetical protein
VHHQLAPVRVDQRDGAGEVRAAAIVGYVGDLGK